MAASSDKSLTQVNKERIYVELRSKLHHEIAALKATLAKVDSDNTTKSVDIINKHTGIIINVLQIFIDNKLDTKRHLSQYPNPIHDLLAVGQLCWTEIPLDVIEMMITAGFSVNEYDERATCLYRAIEHQQFSIVRLLIDHNASCRYRYKNEKSIEKPPIVLLASHTSAPLDLLDLFATGATPHNLSKALFKALSTTSIQTAQHIIKLGASVDTPNKAGRLPIDEFVYENLWAYSDNTDNAELVMCLLPPRTKGEKILRLIVQILGKTKHEDNAVVLQMLHQLIQRLTFPQPIRIHIDPHCWEGIQINDEKIGKLETNNVQDYLALYLLNSLMMEFQFDIDSIPDDIVPRVPVPRFPREECMAYANAVDDLWRTFRQSCKVKSLLRLCILQVRNSMSSLDDKSFQTLLPEVPNSVHRMLTYCDVAERIYEEWCKGMTKY